MPTYVQYTGTLTGNENCLSSTLKLLDRNFRVEPRKFSLPVRVPVLKSVIRNTKRSVIIFQDLPIPLLSTLKVHANCSTFCYP